MTIEPPRRARSSGGIKASWVARSAIGALFTALILVLAWQARADPDLWGHIRFGQDILSSGAIPRHPSYSFTADRPWINHEWLAEVIMALAYRAGTPGLVALLAALTAATLLAVGTTVRMAGVHGPVGVALVAAAALGTSLQVMTVRPQLFSVLLLALLLLVLSAAERRRVALAAVPFLFVPWANLHGGWLVGLGVLGLWAVVAAWKRVVASWQAAAVVVGALGATLLNPYRLGLWTFLVDTVRIGRADIEEWQPIWEQPLQFVPWTLSLAVLVYGCNKLRREWWRTLPAIALALLSVKVTRLEGLFALASVSLASRGYREAGRPFLPHDAPFRDVLVVGLLCLGGVGASLAAVSRTATCLPLMTDREYGTPEAEALLFLTQNRISGRLVTWFDYGQYAIWHLAPDVQVSYDGRRETVYSTRVQRDHLEFYAGNAEYARWVRADYIWLPKDLPVVRHLLAEGWRTAFTGSRSVILAAKSSPSVQPSPFVGPRCFPGP
jgi:hypothetical protein